MEQEQEGRLGREGLASRDGASSGVGAPELLPDATDGTLRPAGVGPVLLFVPALAALLFGLHLWRTAPRGEAQRAAHGGPVDRAEFAEEVDGWRADGEVVARILPYGLSAEWNGAWGRVLAARHHLPAGEVWRLELEGDAPPLVAARARFADAELVPFAPPAGDPLATLAEAADVALGARTLLLWGPRPTGEGRLVAQLADGGAVEVALAPSEFDVGALERSPWNVEAPARTSATGRRIAALEGRLEEVEEAFQRERTLRQERELEWYEFNRTLARLELTDLPRFRVDEESLPEELREDEAPEPLDEDAARRATRAEELRATLRALLLSQRLVNMDLLEVGTLAGGSVGPVVFRLLDERGRLDGTLVAERLRLEASRAARTLTLVLEDGHETRLGVDVPFEGGTRRVLFHDVDPDPWIERMGELLGVEVLTAPDDGKWSLRRVTETLNGLLAMDTRVAWYRLRAASGVVGTHLREVHLEELDVDGHIRRRLFADRMQVRVEEGGVLLVLHDGMTMRGDRRQAFLDGVHRIYLPNAALDAWRAAELPGVGFAPRTAPGEGG